MSQLCLVPKKVVQGCPGVKKYYVWFQVFTAVVIKSIIWDMTPCSPLSFNRRFFNPEDGGEMFLRNAG
jgi:hypothetical protein